MKRKLMILENNGCVDSEHLIFIDNCWIKADELKIGDYINGLVIIDVKECDLREEAPILKK